MYIMVSEPIPSTTAAEIKEQFENMTTLQELADVFAITSNKFWWVEDNEYDYEKGTKEYQEDSKIGSINFGVGRKPTPFSLEHKKRDIGKNFRYNKITTNYRKEISLCPLLILSYLLSI